MDALAPYLQPRFIAGLDIGQMSDPSALAIVEREMRLLNGRLEPYFFVGYLEQIKLLTPYPLMVRGVRMRLERIPHQTALIVDATGVGRTVVDLFRNGWTSYDPLTMFPMTLPGKPSIVALTLTGSHEPRKVERWDEQHVPTLDVIMAFMLALQQSRVQVAAGLDKLVTLIEEARNFEWKKPRQEDDVYSQWKTNHWGDLLFALAIAVWWGTIYAIRVIPGQQTTYAQGARNPLLRSPARQPVGGPRR